MKKWKLGNLCTAALVVFVATNLCRHAVASSGPGLLGDHPGTGIFLSRLLKKCPENFRIIGYGETRNMVKMGNTEDRAAIKIHAGDLIFQTAMTSEFDEAVAQSGTASGSVTHVGIFCLPDTVIETNDYGVVRTDICKFLKGANRNILVRVKNGAIAGLAVERAESFLGEPYNESFSPEPGNGFYCSQLVTESYLKPDGSRYFALRPMRFDEREFWTKYFDELGLPIPDGVPGSHPQQILDQMELLNRTAEIQYR